VVVLATVCLFCEEAHDAGEDWLYDHMLERSLWRTCRDRFDSVVNNHVCWIVVLELFMIKHGYEGQGASHMNKVWRLGVRHSR
jgi:hypothetical protein